MGFDPTTQVLETASERELQRRLGQSTHETDLVIGFINRVDGSGHEAALAPAVTTRLKHFGQISVIRRGPYGSRSVRANASDRELSEVIDPIVAAADPARDLRRVASRIVWTLF